MEIVGKVERATDNLYLQQLKFGCHHERRRKDRITLMVLFDKENDETIIVGSQSNTRLRYSTTIL